MSQNRDEYLQTEQISNLSESILNSNQFHDELERILKSAQQNFEKESKMNLISSPSFNILRVLTAYKNHYSNNNSVVYNAIIFILRKYKPKQPKDWYNAINQLRKNQGFNNLDLRECTKKISSRSQANSKILLAQLMQNWPYKKSRYQSINQGQSQLLSDRTQQPNNKSHYISFEPYQNKQNISNQNKQYKQFVKKNRKLSYIGDQFRKFKINSKNKHQKSLSSLYVNSKLSHNYHFSQQLASQTQQYFNNSIIRKQQETPFTISKVTRNTKQLTQDGQLSEEEQNMIARADAFYKINCFMKIFSILLANFQAHFDYRQIKNKAVTFCNQLLKRKAYASLEINLSLEKRERQKEEIANKLYQKTLIKKTYQVLRVLYETRVVDHRKNRCVDRYNIVNVDFILALLVNQLKQHKDRQSSSMTPKSLPQKGDHFLSTGNLSNLHKLFSYFTRFPLSVQQIESLQQLRKRKLQSKCFSLLKKHNFKYKKYKNLHYKKLIRRSFTALCQRHKKNIELNKIQTVLRAYTQNKLLKNTFYGLLSYTCSNKIYQKKQKYIKNNNIKHQKQNILKIWIQRLKQNRQNKQIIKQYYIKIQKIIILINLRQSWNNINQYLSNIKQNQQKQIEIVNYSIKSKIFNVLKLYRQNKNKLISFQKQRKYKIIKNAIKKWKNIISIKKGLQYIQKYLISKNLRIIISQLQIYTQMQKDQEIKNIELKKIIYKELKNNYEKLNKQRIEKINTIQKNIKKQALSIFINNAYNMKKQHKFNKKIKNLQSKRQHKNVFQNIYFQIKKNQIKTFLQLLQFNNNNKKQIRQNTIKIFNSYRNKQIYSTLQFFISKIKFKKVNRLFKQNRKIQFLNLLKTNIIIKKAQKLKIKKQQKIKTKIFAYLQELKTNKNNIISNVIEYSNKRIMKMALYALACYMIDNNNKKNNLNQYVNRNNKRAVLKSCIYQKNKRKDIFNKYKVLTYKKFIKKLKYNQYQIRKLNISIKQVKLLRTKNVINNIQKYSFKSLGAKNENQQRLVKIILLSKKLFWNRLYKYFFSKVLRRKCDFTAIKFRAIKLCQKSFKVLAAPHGQVKQVNSSVPFNISTQYSSL